MAYRRFLAFSLGLLGLVAAACSGVASAPTPQPDGSTSTPSPSSVQPTAQPTFSPQPIEKSATATPRPVTKGVREEPPLGISRGWKTDFSKHSVPFTEIRSGGPPRDGIPPIDNPAFKLVSNAPEYLADDEPVVSLEIHAEAKAYPLAILMWHEIVNDELGGIPVTVTFCPLCNTAIVFDRRLDGEVFDFGTSSLLRNSDLVMWDRQTESWWQQITG